MTNWRRLIPVALVSSLAFAAPLTMLPAPSFAQVGVSITVAPPALPIYAQPAIPGDGYLWQPGYWGWGAGGYYWVPGTWVQPPTAGLLWTPGYWAWLNGAYLWHTGYWGPHVGFYGGINYGYGYTGSGYAGGRWDHGHFSYNRAVNNFGRTHITNAYSRPVRNGSHTRVSFNGGTHGTRAQPTAAQRTAGNEHHVDPTALQTQHEHAAASNHALLSSVNHGRPPIAATARPAAFTGRGVVGTAPQHGRQPQSAQAGAAARPAERPAQAGAAARPAERPASAQRAEPTQRGPQPVSAGAGRPVPAQHAAPPQHRPQPVSAGAARPMPARHAAPPQHQPQRVSAGPARSAAAPHAAPAHPAAQAHAAPAGGGKHEDEHH